MCIPTLQDCTGVGRPAAERCLLSSIYSTDQPSDALFSCEVAQHLKMATGQEKVTASSYIYSMPTLRMGRSDLPLFYIDCSCGYFTGKW